MPVLVNDTIQTGAATDLPITLNGQLTATSRIDFFDGILPTGPSDPDDGTLLCQCSMSSSAFVHGTGNEFHLNPVSEGTVIADGTLSYWRMKNSADTVVVQGDCGIDPLNDIVFDNADVLIDDVVNVTSFVALLVIGSG
jgi:hypothetical protein